MFEIKTFIDRWVSHWNEPDPRTRAELVRELWADEAVNIVETPEAIRDAAHAVGFPTPELRATGYDELETRVAHAYESFVGTGEHTFRSQGNASRLENIVKSNWEMVSTADGSVAAVGLDVFVLDDDDRIRVAYQFIER